MYNLTQTTENDCSLGRIGPTTTSTHKSLRRYVGATSLRLVPAPTQEANAEQCGILQCRVCGRMQANGLVPYQASHNPTVIRLWLDVPILSQDKESGNPPPLPQIRNSARVPSHEWRRDFPRRIVKNPVRTKLERYELIGPLNPDHFFPTLDAAVDTFCQQTGANWTAPKQTDAEAK